MKNHELNYADEIESSLEVHDLINHLEALFDDFIKERKHPGKELRNEANVLSLIRCFFKRKADKIIELRR